ncbi:winged helix-turn-helix domain-containing protein [Natrinema longum]|uniref:Helix-turn-helix transcriptional regulator n=1 Tax=Natrinema longum TaxID=370324 RepID=A0A8A2U6F6_9EURY|nr:helix-turn-helix domain-containing protein [Natrinema longum]MBZ6494386.1 helix-turn-helix domain-containing protein [Natrinema longum]QSW84291.1 helix-turn-helix transcriptional regulator [Natrinema longum]
MPTTNPDASDGRTRGWQTDDPIDPQAVLAALDDDACRAILEATSGESLTATELSEQCEIPMSTAYRKVEKLTEADLVEEKVRINTSGKHATEYRKNFDDVLVSIADGGGIEIEMTSPEPDTESVSTAPIAGD